EVFGLTAAGRAGRIFELEVDRGDRGGGVTEQRVGDRAGVVTLDLVHDRIGRHALEHRERWDRPHVGGAEVDAVAEVLKGADGHQAQRLAAALRVTGHQLVLQVDLAPVAVGSAATTGVRDGHGAAGGAVVVHPGVVAGRALITRVVAFGDVTAHRGVCRVAGDVTEWD